ncbi:MAG: Ig-like domain-containing protein [Hydrogenoanaerobacterium sp.]
MKTHTGTGKRILSLILAVSMTFSMGLTSAFAASGNRATNSGGDSGVTARVKIDPIVRTMAVGQEQIHVATVTLDSGTAATQAVDWTSSNPEVATVDYRGLVKAVAAGTTTITATSSLYKTASDSVSIEVYEKQTSGVRSVTLSTNEDNIFVGKYIDITATVLLDSGSTAKTDVTWRSDKEAVATVDNNGRVTAVALDDGAGTGYATITATSAYDTTKKASAKIYVSEVKGIEVTPKEVKLINGDSSQLKAELTVFSKFPRAIEFTVTWSSDNKAVATVDKNGLVTAVGDGDAKIYAQSDIAPAIKDFANINIKPTSLSIDATPASIDFGRNSLNKMPNEKTVTVKNTGNRDVTLVQPTSKAYEVGKLSVLDLAVGKTATFTVKPLAATMAKEGEYKEGIKISTTSTAIDTVDVKMLVVDNTAITTAITGANEAKKGIEVKDFVPSSVANGVKFVRTEEMKALDDAITVANGKLTTVFNSTEAKAAAAVLDTAVANFKKAIKTGSYIPSSGGSSSSSSSGTSSGTTTPSATAPSNNVSANGEVRAESVKEETKAAIQDALKAAAAAGKPTAGGVTATVMVKNAESISAATLTEMAATAKAAGGKVELKADTVDATGAVVARLYIDPAAAAKLKGEIKLGVKTDDAATQATKEAFKNFDNKMAVASFAQQGSFGMAIKVAVKVDLTGLNTKTLVFTSFDKKTGKCVQLPKTAYTIDKNGYIHFTTSMGGEILITDKPLVKKAPAKAAAK